MKRLFQFACMAFLVILASCDTLKTLPTNTTGGVFSLNGTWKLTATTDGSAMTGTRVVVSPLMGNGVVKTASNNTYCVRENDALWQNVKGNNAGGFTISMLVNACNGTTVYKDATVGVVNNDRITVTGRTADNRELIQDWRRISQ